LHTRNAAGAAPRLMDMGAEPFLIASTLNLIIAQRLVRKNCTNCIEEHTLANDQIAIIQKEYDIPQIMKVLVREKIIKKVKPLKELTFYKGKGCDYCNNAGYKGRMGVFEALEVTEEIKKIILDRASIEDIQRKAVEQKMITLVEDGFIKAISGITSIEEVMRVTMD
jgi:type IV pilus assembly protein PilB